jgi:hypothetical protein
MIVLAFLPQLRFLDFVMVDQDEVFAAKEQYQDDLMELEEKERMSSAMIERDLLKAQKTALLVDACIDPIETLFDSMFMEDHEITKLLLLPGAQLLKDDYGEKLTALADDVKNNGLVIRQNQLKEITKLNNAILRVQKGRQNKAIEAISLYEEKFNEMKNKLYQTLNNDDDTINVSNIKMEYIEPMKQLCNDLQKLSLEQEIALVETTESIIGKEEQHFV